MELPPRGIYTFVLLAVALSGCSSEKSTPTAALSNLSSASSVEPAAGVGNDGILRVRYPVAEGQTIREARILLNFELDGRNACYVYYTAAENAFLLIDDSGMKSNKAGSGATVIENSQCALDISRSSGRAENSGVDLTLALKFKPAFAGGKQVFLYAETSGGANTGLILRGSWNVTF
jgi:hypothetical protein